ncbi:TetR/AcrR family transcriptional regulator C-terminal domain-containing protein [Mycetocola sp. 2940]|uniref:TetR/AcrR family transcriptional regulator C-terminal domain-containing protein n=1 Tax=Mycetocola sp. 2940 TaxID=3156452 RepID=UPI00339359FD
MAGPENFVARGPRLTRDDVARAALGILDEYGLPDLTMRRLAAALNVQASALYWHFPNKQSLLAELAERIVDGRRADSPAGSDWVERVAAEAAGLRDAMLAYRDGAEVVSSTYVLRIGSSSALERLVAAIGRGGFDEDTTRRAAAAMLHFILGHVSHEQQRLQYDSLGVLADGARPVALDEAGEQRAAFAFGIDLLTAGLRARSIAG